ncbi:MAG: helix-turn-helix domain-containing protein [Planctomycetes bacterium]|nr:helix-turn-helix domain-containing protein [Planctomycetota bacterium]
MDEHAILVDLGRRLRAAREEAEVSVSDLARRSGVSRRHLTEAEAGRANLSATKIAALAGALGLRPSRFFDFDVEVAHPRRIALVGLRGAGKTTVGRKLALLLEVPFVELDRRVEELAGLSLAAIFDLHGAAYFRRLEAEALEKVLAEGERWVLAAGGSIVRSPATFARLRESCRTVWLKADADEHYRRVAAQGDPRPMQGRPRAMEELRALLAERESDYSRCEWHVETARREPDALAAELARRLDE